MASRLHKRRQQPGFSVGRVVSGKTGKAAPDRVIGSVGEFWIAFAVAFVAAWLTFLPAVSGPFLFDDKGLPFSRPEAASAPPAFWIGGVRPLLMATYWLNFLLSGQNPFAYHFINILLHALAAALLYL